ncbi:hypothetical protein ACNKHT_02255 [Shigella flexneri]
MMNAGKSRCPSGDIFKRQIRERGKPERTGNATHGGAEGDLASITAQLEQWRDVSQEPPVWLDIEITTDEYLHDIQRKIGINRIIAC